MKLLSNEDNNATMHEVFVKTERRRDNVGTETLWDKLTLAQQFSACSLFPVGYALKCVRPVNNRFLAIMTFKQEKVTIDFEGNIHTTMNISLRN